MIRIDDRHQCCGCEACVQACPKHCINFQEDEEGFYYPLAETGVCIGCGLCDKVCPMLNMRSPIEPLKIYAAKNKDKEELVSSSSGGLFIVIAKTVIQKGGVVFGAKFDREWNVVHDFTETYDGLNDFMGSKYVQSRIGNCFLKVRDFLKSGREVLFTGTSCQIVALKNFLRHEYMNLLTVDVICHGVPSPGMWRRYLEEMKRNAREGENSVSSPLNPSISVGDVLLRGGKIKNISFRDKRLGWKKYSFTLTLAKASADGKQNTVSLSHTYREDPYMRLFLRDIILRPSCFNCPAKGGKSGSDLTIADFWGIEVSHPEFDDERGVGLLIVNTTKGADRFDFKQVDLIETTLREATLRNSAYYKSKVEPHKRAEFYRKIRNSSLMYLAERLLRTPIWMRAIRKIKSILKLNFGK